MIGIVVAQIAIWGRLLSGGSQRLTQYLTCPLQAIGLQEAAASFAEGSGGRV